MRIILPILVLVFSYIKRRNLDTKECEIGENLLQKLKGEARGFVAIPESRKIKTRAFTSDRSLQRGNHEFILLVLPFMF